MRDILDRESVQIGLLLQLLVASVKQWQGVLQSPLLSCKECFHLEEPATQQNITAEKVFGLPVRTIILSVLSEASPSRLCLYGVCGRHAHLTPAAPYSIESGPN